MNVRAQKQSNTRTSALINTCLCLLKNDRYVITAPLSDTSYYRIMIRYKTVVLTAHEKKLKTENRNRRERDTDRLTDKWTNRQTETEIARSIKTQNVNGWNNDRCRLKTKESEKNEREDEKNRKEKDLTLVSIIVLRDPPRRSPWVWVVPCSTVGKIMGYQWPK